MFEWADTDLAFFIKRIQYERRFCVSSGPNGIAGAALDTTVCINIYSALSPAGDFVKAPVAAIRRHQISGRRMRIVGASVCAIDFAPGSFELDATGSAECTRATAEHEFCCELQGSQHSEWTGCPTPACVSTGLCGPAPLRKAIAIGSSVATDGARVSVSTLHPLRACRAMQSHRGLPFQQLFGLGPRPHPAV